MIKYQYLRQGNLALTIATELDREEGAAYYSFAMKHPSDRFVKKEAIKATNRYDEIDDYNPTQPMFYGWIGIDESLTRNELLLAVLCDIYAKNRLHLPKHYRAYVMWLMLEYNEKVLMGM